LQYDATHIAIAAIFLAAIKLDTKPLNRSKAKNQVERTWYELLETDIEEEALKGTYLHCMYNFVCTFGDIFFSVSSMIDEDIYSVEQIYLFLLTFHVYFLPPTSYLSSY
jgi:hypothetical protein